MDQQQVSEQTKSIGRRTEDLKKRIARKKQIIEMAQTGYKNTKQEIEDTQEWFRAKNKDILALIESNEVTDKAAECKSIVKEILKRYTRGLKCEI